MSGTRQQLIDLGIYWENPDDPASKVLTPCAICGKNLGYRDQQSGANLLVCSGEWRGEACSIWKMRFTAPKPWYCIHNQKPDKCFICSTERTRELRRGEV